MSESVPYILGEVLFDRFPDGRRVLGGAPFNVAWHLAAFGAAPLFLSVIGDDDEGREILNRMETHGMRRDGIQRHSVLETGRVDVLNAESAPEYHFPERSAWDGFTLQELPSGTAPSILYQGSLFLRHECSRQASFGLAARVDCPRFVDVNLRMPWFTPSDVLQLVIGTHCLKASAEELATLAGWFGLDVTHDIEHDARALLEAASIRHAFVTMGAEGARWVTAGGESFRAPAARVERFVDSVGAGDASAAVAVLGLISGWPVPLILERAMRFAALICEIPGAIPDDTQPYHVIINH